MAKKLHTFERAVSETKRVPIHEHIDLCLDYAVDWTSPKRRASMEEFKQITKYL